MTFDRGVVSVKNFSLRTNFQRFFFWRIFQIRSFVFIDWMRLFALDFSWHLTNFQRCWGLIFKDAAFGPAQPQLVFESVSDRISILVSFLTTMTFDRGVVSVKNFSLRTNFQRFFFWRIFQIRSFVFIDWMRLFALDFSWHLQSTVGWAKKSNLISEKQLVFESVSDRISILVSLLTMMIFDWGIDSVKFLVEN